MARARVLWNLHESNPTDLLPPARFYILKVPSPSKHHQQLVSRHSKPHKREGTVHEPEGEGSASDPDSHTEELGCIVHWMTLENRNEPLP